MMKDKLGLIEQDESVLSMDTNMDLKGMDYLGPLFGFIVNKRVLKITYHPFTSGEPLEFIIHPYYLKEFNNRWFLLGYNTEADKPNWVVALDRIVSVEETELPYKKSGIDWEYYFSDFVGVSKSDDYDEPVEVLLEVDEDQFPYIETKPLHQTQRVKSREAPILISIQVIPNYELKSLILSFGEKIRVIKPVALREDIAGRLKRAVEGYGG